MPLPAKADLPAVICLAGPTGSGKTGFAIALAKRLGCEIINADSRQVYAGFPIITAQPGKEELAACPHHLYGFLATGEKLSAGQWAQLAAAKCREIAARGKIPLLVGGTGFYFAALLEGLAEIPPVPPEIAYALAERMQATGPREMHAALANIDPVYAARIHPGDRQRILRALEVWQATGKPFSWWHEHAQRRPMASGPLFSFNVSLAWLEPRLAARIGQMVSAGALAEAAAAQAAQAQGPGWSGIGCRELVDYLAGAIDWQECLRRWLANTRAYAKRQLTWFRSRKNVIWISPGDQARVCATLAAM